MSEEVELNNDNGTVEVNVTDGDYLLEAVTDNVSKVINIGVEAIGGGSGGSEYLNGCLDAVEWLDYFMCALYRHDSIAGLFYLDIECYARDDSSTTLSVVLDGVTYTDTGSSCAVNIYNPLSFFSSCGDLEVSIVNGDNSLSFTIPNSMLSGGEYNYYGSTYDNRTPSSNFLSVPVDGDVWYFDFKDVNGSRELDYYVGNSVSLSSLISGGTVSLSGNGTDNGSDNGSSKFFIYDNTCNEVTVTIDGTDYVLTLESEDDRYSIVDITDNGMFIQNSAWIDVEWSKTWNESTVVLPSDDKVRCTCDGNDATVTLFGFAPNGKIGLGTEAVGSDYVFYFDGDSLVKPFTIHLVRSGDDITLELI